MTRLLALILLAANGLYFVWTSGYLRAFGFAQTAQTEPQHVAQQINPRAIKILSAQEFKRAEELARAEQAARDCVLAGPFDDAAKASLTKAAEGALPAGAWVWDAQQEPARWIVYMGKYANTSLMDKKRAELVSMSLNIRVLADGPLSPGFSLGAFDTQDMADAALRRLTARGVHTARVVKEHDASTTYVFRVPAPDEAVKAKLGDLTPALGNNALHPCH